MHSTITYFVRIIIPGEFGIFLYVTAFRPFIRSHSLSHSCNSISNYIDPDCPSQHIRRRLASCIPTIAHCSQSMQSSCPFATSEREWAKSVVLKRTENEFDRVEKSPLQRTENSNVYTRDFG